MNRHAPNWNPHKRKLAESHLTRVYKRGVNVLVRHFLLFRLRLMERATHKPFNKQKSLVIDGILSKLDR